jgi:type IV pilus assembly protein PilC
MAHTFNKLHLIGVLFIVLLLWKVVPIFATYFAGLGVDLPFPTRLVIALSHFVGSIFGLLIVVAIVAMVTGLEIWYGTPVGRSTERLMLVFLGLVVGLIGLSMCTLLL